MSDFSILKFNKCDIRSSLADIAVEGEFHAQQWAELDVLSKLVNANNTFRSGLKSADSADDDEH